MKKADGSPIDPEAKYIILRYDKDDEWGRAARGALRRFARSIGAEMPELYESLIKEMDEITFKYWEEKGEFTHKK